MHWCPVKVTFSSFAQSDVFLGRRAGLLAGMPSACLLVLSIVGLSPVLGGLPGHVPDGL